MMNFLLQVVDIDDLNKHVCFLVRDETQSSVRRERKRCILLAFVYLKKTPDIYQPFLDKMFVCLKQIFP